MGQRKELIPPWLEDLHATFRPVVRTVTSTTTVKTSEDVNDNKPTNDDEDLTTVISEAPQPSENGSKYHQAANSQGRYFLIHDNSGESDSDKTGDEGVTTLIISISISIVSTILSIIIIVHICRKVRGKTISSGTNSSDEACYECHPIGSGGDYQYHVNSNKLDSIPYQVDSNKINSIPVIPIQERLFCPFYPPSLTDLNVFFTIELSFISNSVKGELNKQIYFRI